MSTLLLVLAIVGAIGAQPVIYAGLRWIRSNSAARQALRFGSDAHVDVVVTTSEITQSMVGADPAQRPVRPLSASGELQGIAALANCLGQHYPKTTLTIHQSALLTKPLLGDVVLLGGPVHNRCSEEFLHSITASFPQAGITFDAGTRTASVGGVGVHDAKLRLIDGVPIDDYALIVMCDSPFVKSSHRAILCAGFTTYGTGAAADYVFGRLFDLNLGRGAREAAKKFPDNVAILLRAEFSNRMPFKFHETARMHLLDS